MFAVTQNYIPILTSEAGLCLTSKNWQEVNVTAASYSLESLLCKPGIEVLKKITDIGHYLACPGFVIFNGMSLVVNKEGLVVLKSPYDGSKIKVTLFDLLELIQHLNPKAVILPKNILNNVPQFWDHWNGSIFPFFHQNDVEKQNISQPYGIYFNAENSKLDWEQLARWPNIPRYISGSFEPGYIQELTHQGVEFVETDEPAKDALQGKVYTQSGAIDLTDLNTQMQFEPIDAKCICPTCSQQFTRAYLHHLLQHTPLLCQRFLIQHNVFYVQNNNRN
ncbi:tRNA-guanine transglycosylase [Legionella longbeachae]|uniref:tRNA-guanine transglycosylase n=1 Tax=Legionella longbeachae TaxID=450 RepID=UPI000A1C093F|nr:tRNA-guanine transglycosylase [Legionella longbeachae]ARM34919.1 tRNA-guanine transglycosylase [Legionella longbeachae]QEY50866.1 tRNA-guanine transglycosylase [Legionella longbeachae]